jgi:hypothetical protein
MAPQATIPRTVDHRAREAQNRRRKSAEQRTLKGRLYSKLARGNFGNVYQQRNGS